MMLKTSCFENQVHSFLPTTCYPSDGYRASVSQVFNDPFNGFRLNNSFQRTPKVFHPVVLYNRETESIKQPPSKHTSSLHKSGEFPDTAVDLCKFSQEKELSRGEVVRDSFSFNSNSSDLHSISENHNIAPEIEDKANETRTLENINGNCDFQTCSSVSNKCSSTSQTCSNALSSSHTYSNSASGTNRILQDEKPLKGESLEVNSPCETFDSMKKSPRIETQKEVTEPSLEKSSQHALTHPTLCSVEQTELPLQPFYYYHHHGCHTTMPTDSNQWNVSKLDSIISSGNSLQNSFSDKVITYSSTNGHSFLHWNNGLSNSLPEFQTPRSPALKTTNAFRNSGKSAFQFVGRQRQSHPRTAGEWDLSLEQTPNRHCHIYERSFNREESHPPRLDGTGIAASSDRRRYKYESTISYPAQRPYKCECGRAFARNEELTRHRRIHSGYKPHRCDTCAKVFGRKDHLNKHIKTHLRTFEKKTHVCTLLGCRQSYTRSDALTRHQWTAHGLHPKSSKGWQERMK